MIDVGAFFFYTQAHIKGFVFSKALSTDPKAKNRGLQYCLAITNVIAFSTLDLIILSG